MTKPDPTLCGHLATLVNGVLTCTFCGATFVMVPPPEAP